MFAKVLVANRGEIAVRVFRTLREMGIASVAVYSEVDRDALFVQHADEAYLLGPGPATESYLNVPRLLEVVRESGAEAVHPGYGFLAENAGFARALGEAGITWIGPPPDAIEAMGSKTGARALMDAAGVPIVPGVTDPVPDLAAAGPIAESIGYPVAVKAAAGGGGKGFRVAPAPEALEDAFEGARREGERFFADGTVYLERYLPAAAPRRDPDPGRRARHRDLARRARLLGAAPPPEAGRGDPQPGRRRRPAPAHGRGVGHAPRARSATRRRARSSTWSRASEFFFLEMNTRIQVEHTVTEEVCGLDLVREQVRVAAGEPLSIAQEEVAPRGHAFECRINAEDASARFMPSPARITAYREPAGPGVRVDSGVRAGSAIPEIYDPMIAKLIVWDVNRESARRRMLRALDEYVVEGPATLIPFHRFLLQQEEFIAGGACHDLLARMSEEPTPLPGEGGPDLPGDEAPEEEPLAERRFTAEVDGRRFEVALRYPEREAGGGGGAPAPAPKKAKRSRAAGGGSRDGAAPEVVATPMQGTVLRVLVEVGQTVAAGDVVCIVEAMKMENEVAAHQPGTVRELHVAEGQAVHADEPIAVIS